jgi:hypothetical protein
MQQGELPILGRESTSHFPGGRPEVVHLLQAILFITITFLVIPKVTLSQGLSERDAAQEKVDSLISHLRQVTARERTALGGIPEKCGFHYQFEVKTYWNLFSPAQQAFIQSVFARPDLQTSILSRSGRFRIHFDTTGANTPALLNASGSRISGTARAYVDSVAAIFDHVWDFETGVLGYPPPPADKGAGGGNEYDVYVLELSGVYYGQTIFNAEDVIDAQRPNPTYTTFIEIDNDFRGYFSSGINGLKVTAAHEFHHSIQIGNYGFWSNDVYYYEITSTWMEGVVYDQVKDYYQYLPYYFNRTTIPFNVSDGQVEYGRSIWGKFIEKRFGKERMRRSWEYMNSVSSLSAIDAALREKGTSFIRELPEFSLWHFYTAQRTDPINYFPDGASYPEAHMIDNGTFVPPSAVINNSSRPLSFQFYRLAVPRTGGSDALTVVVTNVNVSGAQSGGDPSFPFSFQLTNEARDESYASLQNGLRYKLLVNDPSNWKSLTFLNLGVVVGDKMEPYPNPFFAGKSGGVAFPLNTSQKEQATLNIYSTSASLVVSKVLESTSLYGQQVAIWDGRNSKGEFVPSGIYVYQLVLEGKEFKGKIAVVRQ